MPTMTIAEQYLEAFVDFLEYQYRVKVKDYKVSGEYGRSWDGTRLIIIHEKEKTNFGEIYTMFSPDADFVGKVDAHFSQIINQIAKEHADEQQQRNDRDSGVGLGTDQE